MLNIPLSSPRQSCFSGRIIFDHLPKTAGTAVHSWLTETLGNGNVSDILAAPHREAITRYGGNFCVVSGHLDFLQAEGLDPRWRYVTILRDPVDRVLSWLHFVVSNFAQDEHPETQASAQVFLDSNGDVIDDHIYGAICNNYANHFSRILGIGVEDDATRLANSIAAIRHYDVVGIQEDMDIFMGGLARLIGVPPPPVLPIVNATLKRPKKDSIHPHLREVIQAYNVLDQQIYDEAKALLANGHWSPDTSTPNDMSQYARPAAALRPTSDLTLLSARMINKSTTVSGQIMSFEIEFDLHRPIARLQAGIHIHDEAGGCAFGTNSTILEQDFNNLQPGRHRVIHQIAGPMPAGAYTAGFSFYEHILPWPRELYWDGGTLPFTIELPNSTRGIGYTGCIASMILMN